MVKETSPDPQTAPLAPIPCTAIVGVGRRTEMNLLSLETVKVYGSQVLEPHSKRPVVDGEPEAVANVPAPAFQ